MLSLVTVTPENPDDADWRSQGIAKTRGARLGSAGIPDCVIGRSRPV